MGVDSRNIQFAPGLPPGWIGLRRETVVKFKRLSVPLSVGVSPYVPAVLPSVWPVDCLLEENALVARCGMLNSNERNRRLPLISRCSHFTRIGHFPRCGRGRLREGGPISYVAWPSAFFQPRSWAAGRGLWMGHPIYRCRANMARRILKSSSNALIRITLRPDSSLGLICFQYKCLSNHVRCSLPAR